MHESSDAAAESSEAAAGATSAANDASSATDLELELELSPERLSALLASGIPLQLVDIREPWEARIAAIAGAQLIPLGTLGDEVERLRRDIPLVVYCHHGVRSARALAGLRCWGFDNASHLAGGIAAWTEAIDPSLERY